MRLLRRLIYLFSILPGEIRTAVTLVKTKAAIG